MLGTFPCAFPYLNVATYLQSKCHTHFTDEVIEVGETLSIFVLKVTESRSIAPGFSSFTMFSLQTDFSQGRWFECLVK